MKLKEDEIRTNRKRKPYETKYCYHRHCVEDEKMLIRKCYGNRITGQKLICIPKRYTDVEVGDYVVCRKATADDLKGKINLNKHYWFCNSCHNTGCSEVTPERCPFCGIKNIIEISRKQLDQIDKDMRKERLEEL